MLNIKQIEMGNTKNDAVFHKIKYKVILWNDQLYLMKRDSYGALHVAAETKQVANGGQND